jgi:hypothetical protein
VGMICDEAPPLRAVAMALGKSALIRY